MPSAPHHPETPSPELSKRGAQRRPQARLAGALLALAVMLVGSAVSAQAAPPPETLFEVLERAVDELPKHRMDFGAALAEVGSTDPDAIFAWVRDNTGFVAYRGALKGAGGVLMDREGNSLDRALMLERLLEAAGHRVALVRATLSGAALEAAAAAQRRAPNGDADAPSSQELSERAAGAIGLDPATLQESLDQAAQRSSAFSQNVANSAAAQAAALSGALLAGGHPATASQPVAVTDLLADHWWVQVEVEGAWRDLDPTTPGAEPGQPLVAAEARFDLPEVRFLAAVDGACRDLTCGARLHHVQLSVVAETWDGEQLQEHVLSSAELLSAERPQHHVAFAGLPDGWPELDPFGTAAPLEELRAALLATSRWQPTLFVAGAAAGGNSVSADGTVGAARGGGNAGAVGGLGGGLGGMFGGSAGSASGAEGEDAGAFTALWLEYVIHTPGEGVTTERRQVFDLLGPAARAAGVNAVELTEEQRLERALALGGQTDIVIAGAGLAQDALSWAAATRILENRGAWSELYYQGQSLDIAVINQRLADTAGLFPPLDLLLSQRAERLAGHGAGTFVAAYHRRFEPDLSVRGSFDLVAGPVLPTGGADVRQARVAQGALDTVLEAELATALAARNAGAGQAPSVAGAYAADLAAGRDWVVVSASAELLAAAPNLPSDLRWRIEAELAAGRLALVPPGGDGAVGWFSYDPASGALLGRGDRGWGQAMTEYAEQANVILQLRTAINQYAAMSRCLGLALTGPLRGLGPEDSDAQLQECVFTTICAGVHTALSLGVDAPVNWTNVIIQNSIDALWGGTPETGFGGLCGSLWNKLQG
ncbi:MAG: hypothetical protein WCY60_08075 [Trueperaceae bacterium]